MATQNGSHQNDNLANAVQQTLLEYPPLRASGSGVQVDARSGAVTLSGVVRSQAIKDTAERFARQVKGVSAVENRLTVDSDVEVAIAGALAADVRTRVGFPGILVGVVYGIAFLKGSVKSAEIKTAASEVAAKIHGVIRVSNELIAPAAPAAKAAAAKPA